MAQRSHDIEPLHKIKPAEWLASLQADLDTAEAIALAKQFRVSTCLILGLAEYLAYLPSFAKNGKVWPTQQAMAAHCRVSQRQVKRVIAFLRQRGHLRLRRSRYTNDMFPRFRSDAAVVQMGHQMGHQIGHDGLSEGTPWPISGDAMSPQMGRHVPSELSDTKQNPKQLHELVTGVFSPSLNRVLIESESTVTRRNARSLSRFKAPLARSSEEPPISHGAPLVPKEGVGEEERQVGSDDPKVLVEKGSDEWEALRVYYRRRDEPGCMLSGVWHIGGRRINGNYFRRSVIDEAKREAAADAVTA